MIKNYFRTFIILLLIITVPFPVYADYGPIRIDGYYDDWKDKPHMDVYNGNNPPESKINKVSLLRDEDNLYVHVRFASKNNQGITNMTIELFTDKGNRSYFIFPDLWFDGMDLMNEMEMLPEETPEGSGTEDPAQSITTEPQDQQEATDQTTEPESIEITEPESTEITEPESIEITEPESTEQTAETEPTEQTTETEQEIGPETTDETSFPIEELYSNLDQRTYTVADNSGKSNNGQGKKRWDGTWSFSVWKTSFDWDDWEDWDDWDNWEDWDDWDDLFNYNDVREWNQWFDWDDWFSVGYGYYTRNEGEADELELTIPLSSITRNYSAITEVSMKIKKLGQQKIICTGVDSGAFVGVAVGTGIAMLSVGAYTLKRNRRKTDQC